MSPMSAKLLRPPATPRAVAVVLTAVLVAALLGVGARAAVSAPPLPEIAAEDLLASVLRTAQDPPPVSGELAATLGLGIPELPGEAEDGTLADLLGESRLRVERSPDGLRVALLGEHSERLVITDGRTLTTWDSRTLEVHRWPLPGDDAAADDAPPQPADPMTLAVRLVEGLSQDAEVTVDGTARVAGRDAYRLAVVPADPVTTLGRVELDVDAEQRVPLRVALYARGATAPSIALAWTHVSFESVDPEVFAFTPPPGSTVTEHPAPTHEAGHADGAGVPEVGEGHPRGAVHGEGWSAVAVVPLPEALPDDAAAVLPLDGPLLSARVATAEGAPVLLVGLVPLSHLDEVAAELR